MNSTEKDLLASYETEKKLTACQASPIPDPFRSLKLTPL